MRDILSLNIVLIPPTKIIELSINLSQLISKKTDCLFILDNENFFPHITLYQLIIPAKNLQPLIKTLEDLSLMIDPLELKFTAIKSANGFVAAYFSLSEELLKVDKLVVEKCNPLREGYKVSDYWSEQYKNYPLSKAELEKMKKYGYFLIQDLLDPHITLTRIKNPQIDSEITSSLNWQDVKFKVAELGLYILGENGTCNKLIKKFDLGVQD